MQEQSILVQPSNSHSQATSSQSTNILQNAFFGSPDDLGMDDVASTSSSSTFSDSENLFDLGELPPPQNQIPQVLNFRI